MRKRAILFVLLLACLGLPFLGCEDTGSSSGPGPGADADVDADTDTDSDTDIDLDIDTDSDSDMDSDAGTDAGFDCDETDFEIKHDIGDLLIVLDRSNSMAGTLWNTIRNALKTITSDYQDRINFGLMMFPGPACTAVSLTNQCKAPTNVDVAVAAGNATAINQKMTGTTTCGGTPTAVTLKTAANYLLSLTDNAKKYVLLATDGAPCCNASLNLSTCTCTKGAIGCVDAEQCLDDVETVTAAGDLFAADIPVYVLGVQGTQSWANVMQGIAEAGGTTSWFNANNAADIQVKLEEIASQIVSCTYEIDWESLDEDVDPDMVNWYFDGDVVHKDPNRENGWNYTNDGDTGSVTFYGDACEKLKSGGVSQIKAKFGCPTEFE